MDERLAREARAKAEADEYALQAMRDAQIARERADAAAAERAGAREARRRAGAQAPESLREELERLQSRMDGLSVRQSGRGWVLTLADGALFDAGSAVPKAGARRPLDTLAQVMRRHPDREIAVEGFTDAQGPDDANRRLSARRAEAIRQALVARGLDPGRIDARGYGPSFPVASNETPQGRELNRRVEIVINPS